MSVSNPSTFIGHLRRNTEVLFHLGCPSLSPHCTQRSFQRGNGENLKANALFPPLSFIKEVSLGWEVAGKVWCLNVQSGGTPSSKLVSVKWEAANYGMSPC